MMIRTHFTGNPVYFEGKKKEDNIQTVSIEKRSRYSPVNKSSEEQFFGEDLTSTLGDTFGINKSSLEQFIGEDLTSTPGDTFGINKSFIEQFVGDDLTSTIEGSIKETERKIQKALEEEAKKK